MTEVPATVLSFYTARLKTNFVKEYAEYLLKNNVVDSKSACIEMVGKLLSAAIDNGDCGLPMVEEIKQYIDGTKLFTVAAKIDDNYEDLIKDILEDSTEDITEDTLLSFPNEFMEKIKQFQAAKATLKALEDEINKVVSAETATAIIDKFILKYGKLINPKFLEQIKK